MEKKTYLQKNIFIHRNKLDLYLFLNKLQND